jgi:hypothetical protein|tara:strand:- start:2162 stop:2368 length:207 start_codon:yes stop_codon:yes gene_type:complete
MGGNTLEDQWKPIETAPENKRVIVWRGDHKSVAFATGFNKWIGHPSLSYTHWMPIPKPPKGETHRDPQ